MKCKACEIRKTGVKVRIKERHTCFLKEYEDQMTMKTQKTISVMTDEENPVAVELVAEAIIGIDNAIKTLNNSRLNRKALLLLIANNCESVKVGRKRMIVSTKSIAKVLDSINSLKEAYIKK